MPGFVCEHLERGGQPAPTQICPHLLPTDEHTVYQYYRRYTGNGLAFILLCPVCDAVGVPAGDMLCSLCMNCFKRAVTFRGIELGITGMPKCARRTTSLHFVHQWIARVEPLPPLLAIAPVTGSGRSLWLAVSSDGQLIRLDLTTGSVSPLAERIDFPVEYEEGIGHERPLTLVLSNRGDLAAVAQTYGLHGQIFDLVSGRALNTLKREDHCADSSPFSLAFVEHDQRTLLIHATAWNRLEISDPRTGAVLTARPTPEYHPPPERDDPHYLDYFHGRLAVSPNQTWIVDDGWIWQPFGLLLRWSLPDWLTRNVWESEDGPSLKDLCSSLGGGWDLPLCWLNNMTLAVWGRNGAAETEPIVRIFDASSAQEVRRFIGPNGDLYFDHYLFACSRRSGTTVWDVLTGELLHEDPGCRPISYHLETGEFLALHADGTIELSRLTG